MTTALGYFGAALLAVCGLPLLWGTRFADRLFLWFWFWGEVALGSYVFLTSHDTPLLLNYGFNSALVACVLWRRRGRG